jgi:hypothetical protein
MLRNEEFHDLYSSPSIVKMVDRKCGTHGETIIL